MFTHREKVAVGFAFLAAAALVLGYTYMQKRRKREEVLKAWEELNRNTYEDEDEDRSEWSDDEDHRQDTGKNSFSIWNWLSDLP